MSFKTSSFIRKSLIVAFWLLVWQAASAAIDNSIIFVGPWEVLTALGSRLFSPDFWKAIASTFGKISLGFLTAFLLGILLGSLSYRYRFLEELLAPLFSLLKSIPVASFVILALIWMGSENLSVFISFLVVLPMLYINTIAGLRNTDPKLLEMAKVFRVSHWKKFYYIYRPALIPFLSSGCKIALGMSWKSGIAAEVIGTPDHSIGNELYMAKIYLSTADLFAWTLVVIVISILFERLFMYFLNRLGTTPQKGGAA
ncbi:MAG: ABC transporter permease [Lachnospiraceae bacterium]